MIAELNRLVELVEEGLTDDLDVAVLASGLGTTEYHLRRMFSSLAGMPLSEYIRRRRMAVAAADFLGAKLCWTSPCVTATDRPKRSVGLSDRCTASALRTSGETEVPFVHNRSSGSA